MEWAWVLVGVVLAAIAYNIVKIAEEPTLQQCMKSSQRIPRLPSWSSLPRPPTFIVNDRGLKIYYRIHLREPKQQDEGLNDEDGDGEGAPQDTGDEVNGAPSGKGAFRGVIFLMSGYSAHTTRPTYVKLVQLLHRRGFLPVTLDFAGFGYSEGRRCVVEPLLMIEDALQVITEVLGEASLG